ncbi:hypothetical protein FGB62_182g138 [Gracilaria domingensis]|nr:hypothetical protein FGB62_182g138 [Gracilaria domingensis]
MIEEQTGTARNRLEWYYVDEVLRPDTMNAEFKKIYRSQKKVPGMGADNEKTRETFVANLKSYLPVAQARYIDNVVRTVTTHIFDVPIGKQRARVSPEHELQKYPFLASQILGGRTIRDIMKLRDDVYEKRETVKKKIIALKSLREALLIHHADVRANANDHDDFQISHSEQLTPTESGSENGWSGV